MNMLIFYIFKNQNSCHYYHIIQLYVYVYMLHMDASALRCQRHHIWSYWQFEPYILVLGIKSPIRGYVFFTTENHSSSSCLENHNCISIFSMFVAIQVFTNVFSQGIAKRFVNLQFFYLFPYLELVGAIISIDIKYKLFCQVFFLSLSEVLLYERLANIYPTSVNNKTSMLNKYLNIWHSNFHVLK